MASVNYMFSDHAMRGKTYKSVQFLQINCKKNGDLGPKILSKLMYAKGIYLIACFDFMECLYISCVP